MFVRSNELCDSPFLVLPTPAGFEKRKEECVKKKWEAKLNTHTFIHRHKMKLTKNAKHGKRTLTTLLVSGISAMQ